MTQPLDSFINIDSLLRERKTRLLITGASTGKVNLSRLPDIGEEVGVETTFNEYVEVVIVSTADYGNTCRGQTVHNVYKRSSGEIELIIDSGKQVEFSHSKIYAIHRG